MTNSFDRFSLSPKTKRCCRGSLKWGLQPCCPQARFALPESLPGREQVPRSLIPPLPVHGGPALSHHHCIWQGTEPAVPAGL